MLRHLLCCLTLALSLLGAMPVTAQVNPAPALLNFQGRLARPDGTPVPDGNYSLRFSLWSAATGGTERWNATLSVAVRNGTFAALLDLTTGFTAGNTITTAFNGNTFLEIKVGADPPLTPRQQIASVAYALRANAVADGSITSASLAAGAVLAADIANNAVTSAKILDGTITAADLAPGLLNPLAWLLGGNSGTNPANQFLGTTDAQPLLLKVNKQRALRIEHVITSAGGLDYEGINMLGGFPGNAISADVANATVWGGSVLNTTVNINRVTDSDGTVSGGSANRAGNDNASTLDARWATVGGGYGNVAGNHYATVAGGRQGESSGFAAAIGGGIFNKATADSAAVPGGRENEANGISSFAAGLRAKANHDGAFVWADFGDFNAPDFASTRANQVSFRAAGGVRIVSDRDVNSATDSGALAIINAAGTSAVVIDQNEIQHVGTGDFLINFDNATATNINNGTLQITTAGLVGLSINPTFKLQLPNVNTDAGGHGRANAWTTYSSGRWKHNVTTIENPLEKLLKLRGVMFDWNAEQGGTHDIGFVAEEVGKVIPELVCWEPDGKFASAMKYDRVTALAVEAIKAQQKQIETLKTENADLKATLNAVLERLSRLEEQTQTPH